MSFNGYVQVPPDGTGKKIGHVILTEISYNTGTTDFIVGDSVTGVTSGATGTVIKIVGSTASGELYISLDYESALAFVVGENLQVNSVTYAKAGSVGSLLYTPQTTIVDHENGLNGANVSSDGELIMSPLEGPFGFDSVGNLSVSQEMYLGLYQYEYGIDNIAIHPQTSSLGLGETILAPTPVNNLSWTGVTFTNPTNSGSITRIESNMYHPYIVGTSQKWVGTLNCGDSGTAGVVRRWGYFDNEDGLFFELSGSAKLMVIRSTNNGTTSETRIPQLSWNKDTLDGTAGDRNPSVINLDCSKGRTYFIDFQWPVGRVRWGIIARGKKIVCHEVFNGGLVDYPYMRSGVFPARIEQITHQTTGAPVVLRNYSMAVIAGSRNNPPITQTIGQISDLTVPVTWTGSFRPLFSVKSKPLFRGKENRAIALPTELMLYSTDCPLVVQIHKWPVLTGDTWTVPTSSNNSLMGDYTATTASLGTVVYTGIVGTGTFWKKEFPTNWDEAWKIHRLESGVNEQCAFTLMGKLLNMRSAPSSSVTVALNWNEVF
jgi:hypothetical protein